MKKLACLSTLAVLVVGLAAAPQAKKVDLSGTWTGFAERMGSQDPLTLVLEKKEGVYAGKVTDQMGMFPGVEVKNFALKENILTFEFDGGSQDSGAFTIKAELTLTGDTMKGTWKMAGSDQETGAMELSRQK
jgi:hypothetical protein